MRNIKNIEKIISVNDQWKPSDIAFIKSLEWSNQNLVMVFYWQLRGRVKEWPDISKDFFELSLIFEKVSSLKLEFNSDKLQQVSGFDILDVSSNGLEKIRFQIEDYENNVIGFSCRDIVVKDVSNYATQVRIRNER